LLGPQETTKEDLATLYRARWNNELDLRSIRRCKWTSCAAKLRSWFAKRSGRTFSPTISSARSWRGRRQSTACSRERSASKGRCKHGSFRPLIDFQGHRDHCFRATLYRQLLNAIALHRVANRPDRFEPRYRKPRRTFGILTTNNSAERPSDTANRSPNVRTSSSFRLRFIGTTKSTLICSSGA
jgi:hypothetical protein